MKRKSKRYQAPFRHLNMKRYLVPFGLALSFSGSLFLPSVFGESPARSAKKTGPLPYILHEHLSQAETNLFFKDKEQKGIWKQDRFVFPTLPAPDWEIKVFSQPSADGEDLDEKWIRFTAFKKVLRHLRFPDVPPGATLKIFYGLDEEIKNETTAYLDLRIWAGQNEVKLIRVPNKKQWQEEEIDLSLLAFLNRRVTLTVEVTAQNADKLPFIFRAEIRE